MDEQKPKKKVPSDSVKTVKHEEQELKKKDSSESVSSGRHEEQTNTIRNGRHREQEPRNRNSIQSVKSVRHGSLYPQHRNPPSLNEEAHHIFTDNLEENIFAGPHGALQSVPPTETDRLSLMSTHTLIIHKSGEEDEAVDFEAAIEESGHGKYQYRLMCLCGFVYACCSLSCTTLSFVLPAAQYDFQLTSADKGVLNTAPLWGMMIGAYVWGNFADSNGRRFVLLWSLTIDALASFISSFCPDYNSFYILRIFNGFGIVGATSIVFAYMGEFLDFIHRDKYLARLELFWTAGIIALPCIGFLVLPWYFSIGKEGIFVFNSWRLFVFVCGIPSLMAVLFMLKMPESPRFLMLQDKIEESREILIKMFTCNTGKPREEYSVHVLEFSPEAGTYYFHREMNVSFCRHMMNQAVGILKQHRDLFRGRSLCNILITCFLDFGLIMVYYTMMLWVPEILNRQKQYYEQNPNTTAAICQISFPQDEGKIEETEIKIETFIYTIITGLACLPTTILLLYLIEKVSKKVLLCGIMLSASVPAFFIPYAKTSIEVVISLSFLKSMTNLAEAILFCAIVQVFPINTRGTALSLTVTMGRLGSILGNVIFGLLIDRYCNGLFIGMAVNLLVCGCVCLLLPKMTTGHD